MYAHSTDLFCFTSMLDMMAYTGEHVRVLQSTTPSDRPTVNNRLLGVVANHDEEASLLFLEAIAHQRRNARVSAASFCGQYERTR